jgi:hypothetical protein
MVVSPKGDGSMTYRAIGDGGNFRSNLKCSSAREGKTAGLTRRQKMIDTCTQRMNDHPFFRREDWEATDRKVCIVT